MRRLLSTLLLLSYCFTQVNAQEQVLDSVSNKPNLGLLTGGDMGQYLYFPYFTANKPSDKKNFIIRTYNSNQYLEEQTIRMELPPSYKLVASSYNGISFLLIFLDEAKNEDVFISVHEQNLYKKKTSRHSGATYKTLNIPGEYFAYIAVHSNGSYVVTAIDKELETIWEKKHNAPKGTTASVVSANSNIEGIKIVRREINTNGKYSFALQAIQPMDGMEVANTTITTDSLKPYPTMNAEHEGQLFSAGYYYKDGTWSQSPIGAYFGSLNREGNFDFIAKVPYSQLVEDVKSTMGDKLMSPNSTLIFTGATMAHENQQYYIVGQVFTKKAEEGGATITTENFITMKFSFEGAYKGATVTKGSPITFKLKGDLSKTNMIDLGIWLKEAGLLQFSHFVFMPAFNPAFAYKTMQGNFANLCVVNAGIKNDTIDAACIQTTMKPIEGVQTYSFPGIAAPPSNAMKYKLIFNEHDPQSIGVNEFENNLMFIRKTQLPELDVIRVEIMPEPPAEAGAMPEGEAPPEGESEG